MSVVPGRTVVKLLLGGLLLASASARPSNDGLFTLEDSRRPILRGNLRYTPHPSKGVTRVKEQIFVTRKPSGTGSRYKNISSLKLKDENGTNDFGDNVSCLNLTDSVLNGWAVRSVLSSLVHKLGKRASVENNLDIGTSLENSTIGSHKNNTFSKSLVNVMTEMLDSKNKSRMNIKSDNSRDLGQSVNNQWTRVHTRNVSSPKKVDATTTEKLIQNIYSNFVPGGQQLQNGALSAWLDKEYSNIVTGSNQESLDNLILSHTQSHKDRPIQLVPQNRPPGWSEKPLDSNVIVIEDVDSSKLPIPSSTLNPLQWPFPLSTTPKPEQYKPSIKPLRPQNTHDSTSQLTWADSFYPVHVFQKPAPSFSPTHDDHSSNHWDSHPAPGTIPPHHTHTVENTNHDHNHYYLPPSPEPTYKPIYVHTTQPTTETGWTKPEHNAPVKPVGNSEPVYIVIKPKPTQPTTPKPVYTGVYLDTKPKPEHEHKPHYPIQTVGTPLGPTLIFTQTEAPPAVYPHLSPPPTIVVISGDPPEEEPLPEIPVQADPVAGLVPPVPFPAADPPIPQSDINLLISPIVPLVGAGAGGGGAAGGGSEESEEDYDYSEEVQSDEPPPADVTASKPSQVSMFDSMSSLFSKLSILSPIAVSFWIILFGPLSLVLVAAFGVAAIILPWAFTKLWYGVGRKRTRGSKSDIEVVVKSNLLVNETGDGRATNTNPTRATPIGESLKMVTNQLLQAPEATDMVATDVRTPPRVKSQHRIEETVPQLGKGEAIPVTEEKIFNGPAGTSNLVGQDQPSWVLLSNAEQTTVSSKKKVSAKPGFDQKLSNVIESSVDNLSRKNNDSTKFEYKANNKKPNATKDEASKPGIVLNDTKFRNRAPTVVGKVPAIQKNKPESLPLKRNNNNTHPLVSALKEAAAKNKSEPMVPTTTPTVPKSSVKILPVYLPDIVPTTSLLIETGTIESVDETTTETPTTTSKPTRRTSTKKKKKNKIRRRRPTKTEPSQLESKITPDNSSNSSSVEGNPNRPLSTRIYNYLAREVMPSVGVGLVGLVLTAGLAGLLLYPFGGGIIARRNYDKLSGPSPDGHMYYYNDYTPGVDLAQGNVQPEETVFSQFLSGMNPNKYSGNNYESQKYSSNKYSAGSYDPYDYNNANINGYAGSSDYSTLPDSVKNSDYSTLPEASKFYNVDAVSLQKQDTVKHSDYSTVPETSKFYNMEAVSVQHKATEDQADKYSADNTQYPQYTAYTSAASVGTSGTYEKMQNERKKDESEDKSDKSQPQFSALVGSPNFNDFIGSVSVSGSYGTEVNHRQGSLALDHGPRSLDIKSRKVRDVHEDFPNEIDDTDDKLVHSQGSYQSSSTDRIDINKHKDSSEPIESNSNNEASTPVPPKPQAEEFSIMDVIRRLAQVKLKLGVNFLRSTADTFQRYLDNLTSRMETAIRNLETRNKPQSASQKVAQNKRFKRDLKRQLKKKMPGKKYKPQ